MLSGRTRFALSLALAALAAGCGGDGGTRPDPSGPTGGDGTDLNLSLAANGGVNQYRFDVAGTFPYKCGLHPTVMTGNSVVVDPASTVEHVTVTVVGLTTPGFSPSTVTVEVGGTVHWVNPDTRAHTVVNQ